MTEYEEMLRRVLRGELYRLGVMWYSGTNYLAVERRNPRFPVVGPAHWALRKPDGRVLVADYSAHQVVELDYPKLDVTWEFGTYAAVGPLKYPTCVDYNPETDRVLIVDSGNNRVVEVDYKTKTVVNELTAVASGTLRAPFTAFYNPYDPARLLISITLRHYVVETDWAGTEYWSYGTWGSPGEAAGYLSYPYFFDIGRGEWNGFGAGWAKNFYIVADRGNNRVIKIRASDKAIAMTIPCNKPRSCKWTEKNHIFVVVEEPEQRVPIIEEDGFLWDWIDGGIFANLDQLDHGVFTVLQEQLLKLDPRLYRPKLRDAYFMLLREVSLGAGEESGLVPVWGFGYDRAVVHGFADQAETIRIYVNQSRNNLALEAWRLYREVDIPAGGLGSYTLTAPPTLMAVSVVMGAAAGTASAWIELQKVG